MLSLTAPVSPLADWALDPEIHHLNHGSYGGCPRAVLAAAAAARARLEAAPMTFFVLEWQAAIDRARDAAAAFVRAPAERFSFVPSSTTGVAIALASIADALQPGDELLTTDHAYRACRNQLARLAASRGARVVTVAIPLPFDADALVAATAAAITPRTRLALLDHITSPTALVLPLARLLPLFAARGIAVAVDGAHAPGQLDLDVGAQHALGATWYVGNHHKWMCAPKASGFISVAPDAATVPAVTSHGASPEYGPANRLHAELDWAGTHDPTAHLAVPTAIATIAATPGGWPAAIARNHALARAMAERLGGAPLAPPDALGCMAALPIALPAATTAAQLTAQLLRAGWEVPIIAFGAHAFVRVSAHLYNHAGEADALAAVLRAHGVAVLSRS